MHYAPSMIDLENPNENSEEDDDLLNHIYKRQRVENINEIEHYLNAPLAPSKTNLLQWWKVSNIFY
jgi:hypothetical protein